MCIYQIQNKINGHIYVGSAVNFNNRKQTHLRHLRRGTHHSFALQNAYNKYGEENFCFSILEEVDDISVLILKEQKWLDQLKPEYNMTPIAGKNCHIGMKRRKETCEKISSSLKGKPLTEEHKRKISLCLSGKCQSEKTKEKRRKTLSESEKFRESIHSPERSEKIKQTRIQNGGYICTEEMRNKISETLRQKNIASAISMPIEQYSLDGILINTFRSMKSAELSLGWYNGKISEKMKKGIDVIGGFKWEIKNES